MVKIFFLSATGYAPLKDRNVRGLLRQSHGWQADGESWVYGVAIPLPHVDPCDLEDALTSAGVMVLPGINDPDGVLPDQVVAALAKHGVTKAHKTRDVAKIMHQASGMRTLKPHFN
jgi:hypothetical protein